MRPAKVKILGRVFQIKYVEGEPLSKDDNGECSVDTMTLYIREGMVPQQERSVVLHETLHAVSDLMGLKLTEKQIEGLETGLFQIAVDNPRFFSNIRRSV